MSSNGVDIFDDLDTENYIFHDEIMSQTETLKSKKRKVQHLWCWSLES